MCGRARCTLRPEQVARACGIDDASSPPTLQMDRYHPSFNVSPGSYLPVVRKEGNAGKGAVIHCMKWGLIPSFTKKNEKLDHFRMFNARSESVSEKASFRRLVPNNRCLVAVEGFYEWKKDGTKKQPYYVHFNDRRPLVLAALYDYWENSEGEIFCTFTILTTCCSSALQWLHDRMPVILGNKSAMDAWLNGCPSFEVESVLKSYEDPDLVWYPVTPEMGKPSFNGPECIKEIQLKPVEKNPISKFFFKTSEIKCESFPEVKSSSEEATQTNQFEDVKEEPTTHETKEEVLDFGGHGTDNKLEVQSLLKEGAEKCGTKRNYKQFAVDSEFPDTIKMPSLEKKENPKSKEERQQTLLSYFQRR
ncbi:hypothetical protein MRB53_027730 [Persea americana]|uniref:Uncharacterized protein n=1 Tax=Persea americana TaxID=3435 RepID=A0ACC2LMX3_PERAE|nr:hypothetical protein MRB53_027730 [Persea americana]